MNFKRLFPEGEPNIQNPDLFYMQYSNYFGLQALAKNIDINNTAVKLDGLDLTINYDHELNSVTIDIADGYIIFEGELIKVKDVDTSNLTYPLASSGSGTTKYTYLFAEKTITYDPKGDKTYNNGIDRSTWEVTNISLVLKQQNVALTGQVLLATIATDTAEPYSATYEWQIFDQYETMIKDRVATTQEMSNRQNIDNKIVTPSNLYTVMGGNMNIHELSSSNFVLYNTNYSYAIFTIPSGVSKIHVLSAHAVMAYENQDRGMSSVLSGTNYSSWDFYYDDSENLILQVYFSEIPSDLLSAKALVMW